MNPIIVIPARLNSSRLPQKALVDIKGKTMIQRVWEQAIKSEVGEVLVACDDQNVASIIKNLGGNVIMTSPDHPSGSDRIFEAVNSFDPGHKYDFVINLQGDLPNINPIVIQEALKPFSTMDIDIATLANKFESMQEAADPNNVKVAIAFKNERIGKALYFSRSMIPFGASELYHHIGIYAYKRQALERFVSLKPSPLEITEKLEQLRALEDDMNIGVSITHHSPISIDTAEDLNRLLASM